MDCNIKIVEIYLNNRRNFAASKIIYQSKKEKEMKKVILTAAVVLMSMLGANAQGYNGSSSNSYGNRSNSYVGTQRVSHNASLTIQNRSSYELTVKIMRTGGRGLYQTLTIAPYSSGYVSFSKSDSFYTKTKASKKLETLYKKSGAFSIQCDETGYSQATLQFYVSSGNGGTGQSISKSEFDSNK